MKRPNIGVSDFIGSHVHETRVSLHVVHHRLVAMPRESTTDVGNSLDEDDSMTTRSARDSNRAHLRVERYFVEELGWSSVGVNRVHSLEDPIGTEPDRIGGVYVDEVDGHYAVLVRPVAVLGADPGGPVGGDSSPPDSKFGADSWFASRLDDDAGVHAPHMRQAGYWRLVAEVDSADRVAIRALNTDGTLGPAWTPPVVVSDDDVTAASPMLTMTRREIPQRPTWWQRVPLGAWVAVGVMVSVAILSGLWYSGRATTEPSAIVVADPTSTPVPTNTPALASGSIDLSGTQDGAPTGTEKSEQVEIAEAATSRRVEDPTASDPPPSPSADRETDATAEVGSPPTPQLAPTETATAVSEAAPPTSMTTKPLATPEPPPPTTPPEGDTCQGDGYSTTVPGGWSHNGCTVFDPGPQVVNCVCQHHIDLATATTETFGDAVQRISTSNDYTVSSQSSVNVNGRDAQRFELVSHTESGDVGQTVVVINAPSKVVYAAASQQADAGRPGTWNETIAAFEAILNSMAFG